MGNGQGVSPKNFYYREGAVIPVRKLGALLYKLRIISNYYVDSENMGCITSIDKNTEDG